MSQLTMIKFVIVYGSHMLPGRTVFAINDARAPGPPWTTTLESSALASFKFHPKRDQPPQHAFSSLYKARVPRLLLLYTSPHQTGVLMPLEAAFSLHFNTIFTSAIPKCRRLFDITFQPYLKSTKPHYATPQSAHTKQPPLASTPSTHSPILMRSRRRSSDQRRVLT